MSKLVLITGNHPRHIYTAYQLSRAHCIDGWIIMGRCRFVPASPIVLDNCELNALCSVHFRRRHEAESRFFLDSVIDGDLLSESFQEGISDNIIRCNNADLNSSLVTDFLAKLDVDFALTYGCGMVNDYTLSFLPAKRYNLHGGISPWYRGCITHFWPSYMLEPQMTGMTLHTLTSVLDGGDIVHQNSGQLVRGDGLHDLACRTVKSFVDEISDVVDLICDDRHVLIPQKTSGKLWVSSDWHPKHLQLVYSYFDDKIVDYCLDNDLASLNKPIVRAL
ncbi:hypothetical protein N8563_00515 [bacterium]|nr:hypothetical protein [bacterium]